MENKKRKFLVEIIIDDPKKFNDEIEGPVDDDVSMELIIESVLEGYLNKTGLDCEVIKEISQGDSYHTHDQKGNKITIFIPKND